ncbi:MAG: T9SS type A sorting domain-containing protein [Flavobacteriales bacterium]|nr:T9SS type A sorting domain-containing protein [Flavobacteriales bacterium]
MRSIALAFPFVFAIMGHAQTFPIGSTTRTFFDPVRSRNIPCELYYPGQSAGANVPVAMGEFPVLVIGHGFVMTVDAYTYLWQHFVPHGYIVVLPTTEGGAAPNHAQFGADLAYVVTAMQEEHVDGSSSFFGRVAATSALMGHSMGGGASFLGAANNASITTVVNFAAAETTPSAIAAAAQVLVPTLVFAGSADCVTPPAAHQVPMYNALTVDCRALVSITDGGHCYFGDPNFLCTFGETTCGLPPLSRAAQQAVVKDLATPWLDHQLKGDLGALPVFLDSLASSSRITAQTTCVATGTNALSGSQLVVWPVPADDHLRISGCTGSTLLRVYDLHGRLWRTSTCEGQLTIDCRDLPSGAYVMQLDHNGAVELRRIVIAHER